MSGIGELESANRGFPTKPFKLFWIDNNIGRVCTAGKFSAARAVAILKHHLWAGKLISDAATQATTFCLFTHVLISSCSVSLTGNDFRCNFRKYQCQFWVVDFCLENTGIDELKCTLVYVQIFFFCFLINKANMLNFTDT